MIHPHARNQQREPLLIILASDQDLYFLFFNLFLDFIFLISPQSSRFDLKCFGCNLTFYIRFFCFDFTFKIAISTWKNSDVYYS